MVTVCPTLVKSRLEPQRFPGDQFKVVAGRSTFLPNYKHIPHGFRMGLTPGMHTRVWYCE